jgi:hypothetical protein
VQELFRRENHLQIDNGRWIITIEDEDDKGKDKSTRGGITKRRMTVLECLSCAHKFSSNEVELTNTDISHNYFRINWTSPKCNTEGLTTFIDSLC